MAIIRTRVLISGPTRDEHVVYNRNPLRLGEFSIIHNPVQHAFVVTRDNALFELSISPEPLFVVEAMYWIPDSNRPLEAVRNPDVKHGDLWLLESRLVEGMRVRFRYDMPVVEDKKWEIARIEASFRQKPRSR